MYVGFADQEGHDVVRGIVQAAKLATLSCGDGVGVQLVQKVDRTERG